MNKTFIELPELTLKALFEYSTSTYDKRPALQFVDGESTTYAELAQQVQSIQEMLYAYGIKEGDRVALYAENMPNWVAVYFAVSTMGAVIVPILPDFHTSEAMHIAIHAECKAACDARASGGGGDDSRLDTLIDCLNQFPAAASYFPKDENGVRKL